MASMTTRTGRRSRWRVSLRNTAVEMAIGTLRTSAMPTCSKVPTMAWAPPPAVAGRRGVMPRWSLVKNRHVRPGSPFTTM